MRPVRDVVWVESALHDAAMAALLAADRRALSLVNWVGFTLMRRRRLDVTFAFDDDFAAQGVALLP